MFIILVTDFANVQEAFGPFETREAAHRWADSHLRKGDVTPIYRVVPLNPPGSDPTLVHLPG